LDITKLGWSDKLQSQLEQIKTDRNLPTLTPARVTSEYPGAYHVLGADGPADVQLAGRLRHAAQSRLDLPAVGDWVAVGAGRRVEAVLARTSCFVRKEAYKSSEPQVIAANIDVVFVVTAAGVDFNPRRIERYLSAIWESGAAPVLVINKIDLCPDKAKLLSSLGPLGVGLPVACISALSRQGKSELDPYLCGQQTIALVGSSGVGKSTISNWLLGYEALTTQAVSEHDGRGQHTTTHRELVPLPAGGALVDTPGMRELGLYRADVGSAFAEVEALTQACRFADCQHGAEPGCALNAALETGEVDRERVASYFKLRREALYQEQRRDQSARQAQKRLNKSITLAQRQRAKGPFGGKLR
jgi:ribosome biogenesis GTPase / thiamine phosphate phosphatase